MNFNHLPGRSTLVAALFCTALSASAITFTGGGTKSPVQSPADPLKLPIVGPVLTTGSDPASKNFDNDTLPEALAYVKANLPEGKDNSGSKIVSVDPSKIVLASDTALRAYFVSEGADWHNTLGFNTTGTGTSSGNPKIIFPDASSSEGLDSSTPYGTRTPTDPLLPGDFVNMGKFKKGTSLDFFLIAQGATGGGNVYSGSNPSSNPDGLKHMGIFALPDINSPYLFLTFEDMWGGGDKDFNDVVVAIYVGAATVKALLATPEPSMYLTLGGFLALAIWAKRRSAAKAATIQA